MNIINYNFRSLLPLLKSSIWNGVGIAISRIIIFISTIALANILGVAKFGEYGVLNSTILLFSGFIGSGIGMGISRYVPKYLTANEVDAGNFLSLFLLTGIVIAFISCLVLFTISPWLANKMFHLPKMAFDLRLSALVSFVTVFVPIVSNIFISLQMVKINSYFNVIYSVCISCFTIIGGKAIGVTGVLIGLFFAGLFANYIFFKPLRISLKRFKLKFRYHELSKYFKEAFSFLAPSYLLLLIQAINNWASNIFLVDSEYGFEDVALINIAIQFQGLVMMFATLLNSTLIPFFSAKSSMQSVNKSVIDLVVITVINSLLYLPIIFGIIFFRNELLMMFNIHNKIASNTVTVMMIAVFFNCFVLPINNFIVSKGNMWVMLFVNFLITVVSIYFYYYFNEFGALGIAYSKLVVAVLYSVLIIIYMFLFLKSKVKYV